MSQSGKYQVWLRYANSMRWAPLNPEPETLDYCEYEVEMLQEGDLHQSLLILPWGEVPDQDRLLTLQPPRKEDIQPALRALFAKRRPRGPKG